VSDGALEEEFADEATTPLSLIGHLGESFPLARGKGGSESDVCGAQSRPPQFHRHRTHLGNPQVVLFNLLRLP